MLLINTENPMDL